MQVEGYPPGEERKYTPPDYPDLVVWIKTPTEGVKRRLAHAGARLKFDPTGEVVDPGVIDMSALIDRQERFVRECVIKVEGYKDAAGRPITNAEELIEHGASDVLADVASEIEYSVSLSAERAGKSDASPGS